MGNIRKQISSGVKCKVALEAEKGHKTSAEISKEFQNLTISPIKARSPQTNGICERFHKTILNEFYQVAFRKTYKRH